MVKGNLAHVLKATRQTVEEAPFPDEWWKETIGRVPKDRSKLTEAEVFGILYLLVIDQYAPQITTGPNRAKRRAKKK
jgi:hypothetical protein